MTVLDPQAVSELRVYLGVLVVLLVIRIPQVRALLVRYVAVAGPQARRVAPENPGMPLPQNPMPQPLLQWPTLYNRKKRIAPDELAEPARLGEKYQPSDMERESREREPTH
jgi:hypothetical protein